MHIYIHIDTYMQVSMAFADREEVPAKTTDAAAEDRHFIIIVILIIIIYVYIYTNI